MEKGAGRRLERNFHASGKYHILVENSHKWDRLSRDGVREAGESNNRVPRNAQSSEENITTPIS